MGEWHFNRNGLGKTNPKRSTVAGKNIFKRSFCEKAFFYVFVKYIGKRKRKGGKKSRKSKKSRK
jgi:hypothetical protein